MKKIFYLLITVCLLSVSTNALAEPASYKEIAKERKEMAKWSKKELKDRATKDARKDAKRLAKEGWKVSPGALSIDKQLDNSYLKQYEFSEDLTPRYIMSEAMAVGQNYDGAKIQALELAKMTLAGQIQTEISGLIENTVSNQQLSADDAATVTKSVAVSKNLISQNLGRIYPIVEIFRTLDNGNKEVLVRVAYNFDTARQVAKDAVRKDLEKQGDNLHKDLEKLLGW